MRRFQAAGLAAALAVAAAGGTVAADPRTPQLSPLHRQREDAQRLTEQQQELERTQPGEGAPEPRPPPPVPSSGGRHTTRAAGQVFLGIAGVSAIFAVVTDDADTLLLGTSVVSGVVGLLLVLSDRSVAVAPAVSSSAVGIAVIGRM